MRPGKTWNRDNRVHHLSLLNQKMFENPGLLDLTNARLEDAQIHILHAIKVYRSVSIPGRPRLHPSSCLLREEKSLRWMRLLLGNTMR